MNCTERSIFATFSLSQNNKEVVVASLYIYSDLGVEGVALDAPADFEDRLTEFLRTRTKPLSVGDVAKALGGSKAEARRATVTVKVAKMSLTIQRGSEVTYLKVHDDRKPGINHVKDWRTRRKPFNMDGSCAG